MVLIIVILMIWALVSQMKSGEKRRMKRKLWNPLPMSVTPLLAVRENWRISHFQLPPPFLSLDRNHVKPLTKHADIVH